MSGRFDIAAGVAREAAAARISASARAAAWHEPRRVLEATEDLLRQADGPLTTAHDLESTSLGGERFLRRKRTAPWADAVRDGATALLGAEHGLARYGELRATAVATTEALRTSPVTIALPRELNMRPGMAEEYLEVAGEAAARVASSPKTGTPTYMLESASSPQWHVRHSLDAIALARTEIADIASAPSLVDHARFQTARAQARVLGDPIPSFTYPSNTHHGLLSSTAMASHMMQQGAESSAGWSEATLPDVVAAADAVIDAARGAVGEQWLTSGELARLHTARARDVIASTSQVPGAATAIGHELAALEDAALGGTMAEAHLDDVTRAFESVPAVGAARIRTAIGEPLGLEAAGALSPADDARAMFEARLEQTTPLAIGG